MTTLFIVLFAPTVCGMILSYTLFCYEEANRTGVTLQQCLRPVLISMGRSLVSDTIIFWLLLPGRLWARRWRRASAGDRLVVLVHGLFHNPSAWLRVRRWMHQHGHATICLTYSSWKSDFESVAAHITAELQEIAQSHPHKEIHLVGHSLGGLLLRTALGRIEDVPQSISTLTTIGTPYNGSKLTPFALSTLGRFLTYDGQTVRDAASLPYPEHVSSLALHSPTDNMVLPLSSLHQTPRGWSQQTTRYISHPAMLYDKSVFNAVLEHIEGARSREVLMPEG